MPNHTDVKNNIGNTYRQIIMKPSDSRCFFDYFHADGLCDDDGGDRSAYDNGSND